MVEGFMLSALPEAAAFAKGVEGQSKGTGEVLDVTG